MSVTQSFLLSPVVVLKVQGRLNKSLLSLWRRLSLHSTESPYCVHTVYSPTQRCPLGHTVVAAAQHTLAELVEGDQGQRLSKPLLSWWKESMPGERESDSATLAELVEGVRARGEGVRLSSPC